MFNTLRPGSTIGVVSPAWIPDKERLENGINYLQNKGFRIKRGMNLGREYGYFAGLDTERISDLHDMYRDSDVNAIICSRGGWGGLRMLNKIDYRLISINPKPIIGYSDITSLQLAIWTKTHIPSFSGPMVGVEMGKGINPFTEEHFWGQLLNQESRYEYDFSDSDAKVLNHGRCKGHLLGGCLSLVTTLLGTPYCPDFKDAILFLEDVDEKPYKIDRYFAHLYQAGVFESISGLILGNFIDCEAESDERSLTLYQIFADYFSRLSYPVIQDFPYGHGDIKFTMPIGIECKLDTESHKISLTNPFIS
jgi:muramoyltetrapeptide carboxypeptidase